jgi:hypothetical protein
MSTQRLNANRSHLDGDNLLLFPNATTDAELLEQDQIRESDSAEHFFPTGHKLLVNINGQSIAITDIHGQLQVEIDITAEGPQIRLNGGQLDLHSPEHIALDCQSFRVQTVGNTDIIAKGRVNIDSTDQLRFTCADDVYVRGKVIWLN